MKKGIHPEYQKKVALTCSCGASLEVGSTDSALRVEVCSSCHPFYTGKTKLVDVAGRVDRFKRKLANSVSRIEKSRLKSKSATKKTKKPA